MKKAFTFVFSVLISYQSFGQSYKLASDTVRTQEDWENIIPGTSIAAKVDLTIDFPSLTSKSTKWTRTNNILPAGWYTSVCDLSACYDTANSYKNEFSVDLSLTGGAHTITGPMIVDFYPSSAGYAVTTLHIYDKNQPGDQITATFIGTATGATGVGKVSRIKDVVLAPVPARTNLSVFYEASLRPERMEVYDILGKLIYSVPVAADGSLKTDINVSGLQKGLYFLRIYTANHKILTRQFSKE